MITGWRQVIFHSKTPGLRHSDASLCETFGSYLAKSKPYSFCLDRFSRSHKDTEADSKLPMDGSGDSILHQCIAKIQ